MNSTEREIDAILQHIKLALDDVVDDFHRLVRSFNALSGDMPAFQAVSLADSLWRALFHLWRLRVVLSSGQLRSRRRRG